MTRARALGDLAVVSLLLSAPDVVLQCASWQYKGAPKDMEIDAILDEEHWLINHAPEHI